MPSNTQLNNGSGGDILVTKQVSHDGDTAKLQAVSLMGVSGTEDSYTIGDIGGDGTNGLDVDVTRMAALVSNSGVDIGDVTVNNGAGATSVPVQGAAATDAAVAGNPILAGARASAAAPTDMSADGDAVPLWATLKGALNVADGGGTLSIDDGAGNISIDDGGNVISVDWNGTAPPIGAGTEAAALRVTVATDSTGVLSVDDNGGALTVDNGGTFAVQESGSHVQADDAAFTPATSKVMMAGFTFDDVAPDSVNEGDGGAARMSANRNQYVQIRDNAGNERGLNIDANGEIQISGSRNALTVNSHAVTNAGTFAVQVDGNALTSLQLIDDIVYTDDTSTHSTGTSKGALFMAAATPTDGSVNANDIGAVAMTTDRKLHVSVQDALPAGTNAIGKLAANSGVDIGDVDVTSIAAGTNNIGNVGLIGRTSGGMTIFKSIDIDETEEDVKTSAGQVFSISAFNHTAAPIYLKFYNATAANVTVGSTTPVLTFTVPGNADSDGAGFIWNNPIGFAFGTAISVAATTGIADADTGAPAGNACSVMVGYA